MEANCKQVEIPDLNLIKDKCKGVYYDSDCMTISQPYPEINAKAGDSIGEVIGKLVELSVKMEIENQYLKEKVEELLKQITF